MVTTARSVPAAEFYYRLFHERFRITRATDDFWVTWLMRVGFRLKKTTGAMAPNS